MINRRREIIMKYDYETAIIKLLEIETDSEIIKGLQVLHYEHRQEIEMLKKMNDREKEIYWKNKDNEILRTMK